jgi:hypothetical protein
MPIPIGCHITVTSIHDIDTAKELATLCFDVDFFIRAVPDDAERARINVMDCGTVPANRDEAVEELKGIFAETFVSCQVSLEKEDMTTDDWGDEMLPDVYGGEVKMTATVKVDFDLTAFPFDIQDFPLRVYQQMDRGYELVHPGQFWKPGAKSSYAQPLTTTPNALVSEEWRMEPPIHVLERTDPAETISDYSLFSVHLKLARKGAGYASRFMSVMAAMSLSGVFPLLATPRMEAGDALGYEIGLLFAVVAFQLLISTFLPVTSTTTALDQYAFFLFAYIFACMVAITAVSWSKAGLEGHEETMAAWLLGVWALFHMYYAWIVRGLLRGRDGELSAPKRFSSVSYVCTESNSIARPRAPNRGAVEVTAGGGRRHEGKYEALTTCAAEPG